MVVYAYAVAARAATFGDAQHTRSPQTCLAPISSAPGESALSTRPDPEAFPLEGRPAFWAGERIPRIGKGAAVLRPRRSLPAPPQDPRFRELVLVGRTSASGRVSRTHA